MQNVIFAALSVNPRFLFLVRLHYNASYAINEKKKMWHILLFGDAFEDLVYKRVASNVV